MQCNRGHAPKALATCFLLIAASILAARKLALYDGGSAFRRRSARFADAIPGAEEMVAEIGRRLACERRRGVTVHRWREWPRLDALAVNPSFSDGTLPTPSAQRSW
jgi:hypothetical protein